MVWIVPEVYNWEGVDAAKRGVMKHVILLPLYILRGYVGTNGANLSHFWRANHLVSFRNFETCSYIHKYHALGHPSVKLQLTLSSQIVDIIICPHPIFQHRCYLSLFGLFVLRSTNFVESLWDMGQNKNINFCTRMYRKPTKNKLRADKSW